MSNIFREYLKKIGSGVHTGEDLSREEAADATRMMLLEEATPAQIGAFLMVHRIKRPTAPELAGMLDAYDQLGPKLQTDNLAFDYPVTVLGTPYDGRSRTAPVTTITALLLATAGVPVVMHGGDRMPTKYGLPLITIWQGLGVDFSVLSLTKSQQLLEKTGLTFIYLPHHFSQANQLVPYRNQIGKRPPLSTLELIWSPCLSKNIHVVSGFVHPPTENLFRDTFELRGFSHFTTIKGLEGSCDLPQSRTAIIGLNQPNINPSWERFFLHPSDYDLAGKDVTLDSAAQLIKQMQGVLIAQSEPLLSLAIYNGGFYLWRCGVCADMKTGLTQAEALLTSGKVANKLREISAFNYEL
ncbi:anthranilate phosphoribosyltransferase family protein [Aphanothece sacrum]|uniref:Anthranilate phosphoribosyltransferase n=1 Tax=Aphanothece sacrum FPU1 TaxID=1920663 RepID=A0A401IN95_APHSA|nr:anthranilate phosphoribosyltransferase family protein [Aphanothece sacrum]GBF82723.1 anthranilate phosphoribosyltransferase [Aphanothece sacrum FPU1]GBF84486.1 anthranilate phosphoribosyltransferase [Aphanothece sacrum FPU3]